MWQTGIGNYGTFSALLPHLLPKNQKNQNLWKNEKNCTHEILSFYTCVPKTTIIWGNVPEILGVGAVFSI